jgi:hypothetical protein
LASIKKIEEERYREHQIEETSSMAVVRPLGVIVSDDGINDDSPFDKEAVVAKLALPVSVRAKLAEWLPASLRLTKLDLIYSTNFHGRTLESLYRHCQKAKHTIVLIEPLDSANLQAVGMYASQTWQASSKVYGDGSCFLFRLVKDEPDASKCWKWKPKGHGNILEEEGEETNNQTALLEQFQVSTRNFISMGGNAYGASGLRLNEDLTKGESGSASGFDNEPLVGNGMFEVGLLEVYQLVRQMDEIPVS